MVILKKPPNILIKISVYSLSNLYLLFKYIGNESIQMNYNKIKESWTQIAIFDVWGV